MENSKLISIIIPVYNVERYIEECLESILAQTYTNFEAILVDDGSTDSSGLICDKYVKRDQRFSVIHKGNGGLSDARNVGIKKATGEYITYIDSDDAVSECFLEVMLENAIKYDAQIVQACFTRDKSKMIAVNKDIECTVYNKEQAFKAFLKRRKVYVASCCKLYKRELVKDIDFPVGLVNEDNFTVYKYIYNSDVVVFLNAPLYWHRINQTSIMQSGFTTKKLAVLQVPDAIRRYVSTDEQYYRDWINYYEFRLRISVYNRLLIHTNKKEFINEKLELLNNIKAFSLANIFDLKFKIIKFMLVYMKNSYLLMIRKMYKNGDIS